MPRTTQDHRLPPSQDRSRNMVAALLRGTERVVAMHGYKGATTNRIAEASGVSIGSLYRYFPSKEALIEAAVEAIWKEEIAAVERSVRALSEQLPSAARAIEEIVGAFVAVAAEHLPFYTRWYTEAPNVMQLAAQRSLTERAIVLVRSALRHIHAEVRVDDIDFAAYFAVKLVTVMSRVAMRDRPDDVTSGQLGRQLSDVVARYLLRDTGSVPAAVDLMQPGI